MHPAKIAPSRLTSCQIGSETRHVVRKELKLRPSGTLRVPCAQDSNQNCFLAECSGPYSCSRCPPVQRTTSEIAAEYRCLEWNCKKSCPCALLSMAARVQLAPQTIVPSGCVACFLQRQQDWAQDVRDATSSFAPHPCIRCRTYAVCSYSNCHRRPRAAFSAPKSHREMECFAVRREGAIPSGPCPRPQRPAVCGTEAGCAAHFRWPAS